MFQQTSISFKLTCFVPSSVETGQRLLRRRFILIVVNVFFSYFAIISPSNRAWPCISTKFNLLYPRILCTNFGAVVQKDIHMLSMYFPNFAIISPWKKVWPFIWKPLNSLYPRMLCAKFGWNWPIGSGDEDEIVKMLCTDRYTNRRRTTGMQKSSIELSAQVSLNVAVRVLLLTYLNICILIEYGVVGLKNIILWIYF